MVASCSGLRTTSLSFCERSFDFSWTENWKTPSNVSSDSVISILIRLCSGCRIMHKRQISDRCHILIDGLITNQIALLLPVRGRTEFGKMFGIDCRRFLFSPPPPPSRSPPPHFSPIFCLPQACSFARPLFRSAAFSLARFIARLFDLRLEKERKRLLRRLCYIKLLSG